NLLAFSGQELALEFPGPLISTGLMSFQETPGTLVVVNTLNTHPVLGQLALLNTHRIVFPLRFGGSAGLDDWTLADWCDQCHRKGGLVTWAAPARRSWLADDELA